MTDDNDTTDSPSKRPPNRRVKTPTVLQMEATECGAASLGIILGYYGRIVPLEELREICGVSRDGSKAINVIKAARHYGLETHAFTTDPEALREMELPQVLFWNFNHFLVVEGFKGDTVYLNDPALGPRTVSYEELDESFTGVVMTFSPGQDFMQTGRKPSLAAALRRRLIGSEISLLYIILAGLGLVIPGLLVPAFLRVFVDNILVGQLQGWLGPLLLGMGLTLAVTAALTWLREHYLLRLETKLAISTSSHFFWHILRLPIVFFSQRYAGEVGSRVAINDRVAQLLSGELATTVVNMITVFFFLGLMLWYDWLLTLVGVAIVLLNVYALRLVSRRRVDGNRRLLNELGKMQGTAMSGLQTIETIKAGGGESDFFARWAGYQAKVVNAQQELAKFTEILAIVPLFLTDLTVIAILGVGGLRVMDEQMTLGTLVAFQALMLSFVAPFNRLVELGSRLQEAEGDMNRVDDVLRYDIDGQFQPLALGVPRSRGVPPALEVVDAPVPSEGLGTSPSEGLGTSLSGAEGATKLTGHIELRDVAFGYSRLDPPLIENFDLALKPGSRVALVGATGSGKSTAARLIEGLYDPWSGELLFDGRPRSELPRALLTNSLAVVDQEIFLFEGTVRDNLTLWDATISETQMLRAAKDAVIHDVIAARTGGYAGQVAENGRNFSGGERQRLEMARALVGDPSILILDEATSALDPALEQQIDDNIRRRGCTTLIIAHRLSTIRDCDEIIVLDKGKVVERGTHEQMIRRKGPYSRLIKTDALRAEKSRTEALLDSLL